MKREKSLQSMWQDEKFDSRNTVIKCKAFLLLRSLKHKTKCLHTWCQLQQLVVSRVTCSRDSHTKRSFSTNPLKEMVFFCSHKTKLSAKDLSWDGQYLLSSYCQSSLVLCCSTQALYTLDVPVLNKLLPHMAVKWCQNISHAREP